MVLSTVPSVAVTPITMPSGVSSSIAVSGISGHASAIHKRMEKSNGSSGKGIGICKDKRYCYVEAIGQNGDVGEVPGTYVTRMATIMLFA